MTELPDPPDPWSAVAIQPGDYIRHATSWGDWWELVVAWGPDGRMITVDRNNKISRYSDPTDRWEVIDPPEQTWQRQPRGFTAANRKTRRYAALRTESSD